MTRLVLDASVVVAWFADDEESDIATRTMEHARGEGAVVVPQHWSLEVANVFIHLERRGRMTSSDVAQAMALLGALRVEVDPFTSVRALHEVSALAKSCRLTAYDAAYLELAQRLGLPLATLDQDLRRAAPAAGVALF